MPVNACGCLLGQPNTSYVLHLQIVLVKPEPGARRRGPQFLDLTVSSSVSQGTDLGAEQADGTEQTSPAPRTGHAADR